MYIPQDSKRCIKDKIARKKSKKKAKGGKSDQEQETGRANEQFS